MCPCREWQGHLQGCVLLQLVLGELGRGLDGHSGSELPPISYPSCANTASLYPDVSGVMLVDMGCGMRLTLLNSSSLPVQAGWVTPVSPAHPEQPQPWQMKFGVRVNPLTHLGQRKQEGICFSWALFFISLYDAICYIMTSAEKAK